MAYRITSPLILFSLISFSCWRFTSAYIAYQGQFHWHRTEAARDYFDQVDIVVETFNEYCQAQQEQEVVDEFLEEWEILREIKREALDFQLLEYLGEPTMTNQYLAELEVDMVPFLEEGARLSRERAAGWTRPWRKIRLWRRTRRLERASKKGISRFNQRRAVARRNQVLLSAKFPFRGSDSLRSLSEQAREEYHQLIRDHQQLLDEGSAFALMDADQKTTYVESLKRIEERWDVALGRFKLMGALCPDFLKERLAYLSTFGMNEQQYQQHLETNRHKLQLGIHAVFRIDEESEKGKEEESVSSFRRIVAQPFRAAGRIMAR